MNAPTKHVGFLLPLVFGLVLSSAGAAPQAQEVPPEKMTLSLDDGAVLRIESRGATLETLIGRLADTCAIEVAGLEGRGGDEVHFAAAGPMETVIKSLLREIGVANYSMEYLGDQLLRVRVLPLPATDVPPAADARPPAEKTAPAETGLKAVRVVGLTGNGQVRDLDVQPDDLILTYNGIRITNVQQLIGEVRGTSPEQSVEMLVIRNRLPIRVYLSGGFIGIRIRSETIDGSGLEKYLP